MPGLLPPSGASSFEDEAKLSGMCRNVRGVRWHPDFTDLIPADGGKPEGMKRFMRHYGWTREQTIAFGDGGNDADMLAFAGIGVAMGNATEPAKAAEPAGIMSIEVVK